MAGTFFPVALPAVGEKDESLAGEKETGIFSGAEFHTLSLTYMSESNAAEEAARYPAGRYHPQAQVTTQNRAQWLDELAELPDKLKQAIAGLSDEQLDAPYRAGGWTSRQVVHHLADSHMNSYMRFRHAVTEDAPVIKPYDEARWADLTDAKSAPVDSSLGILQHLHARWILLLRGFGDAEFARVFVHPERGEVRLDTALGLYAWHGRHHVAQIVGLRKRNGW
jgi:uncharacterized damage-inducible protein DinB